MGFGANPGDRARLLPKWRPILVDPREVEPTRWLPGGRLVAAAEAMDRNMIGSPNELISSRPEKDVPTPSQLVAEAYGASIRDGWIILDPDDSRERAPRDEAAALIAECVRRGGVPLDAAASWAARTPGPFPFTNWVGSTIEALLPSSGGPYGALSTLIDGEGLRLWDALGGPARRALRDGRTLDLATLPPAGKRRVFQTAFWNEGVEGEPTELLPNGIEGGTLRMTVDDKPIFVPSLAGSDESATAMTPEDFGRFLAGGDAYRGLGAERFKAFNRFRMGGCRTYHLLFALGRRGVPMAVDLQEVRFPPSAPLRDRLPVELAQRVETARVKAANTPRKPEP